MGRFSGLKPLIIIYLFAVHLFLLALIVKTDFIPRLEVKLGIAKSDVRKMIEHHIWADDLAPNEAIIFLGDSITQGLATAAISPSTINYGIDSENTIELLYAIPLYKSLNRSSIIVLTIGINDIAQDIDGDLSARYKEIIAALPSETPLIWNAVMPAQGGKIAPSDIREANKTIKMLCENRKNCTYLDTWEFFADKNGQINNHLFLPDKIHLNGEGYRAWIRALSQAIKAISVTKTEPVLSHDAPR